MMQRVTNVRRFGLKKKDVFVCSCLLLLQFVVFCCVSKILKFLSPFAGMARMENK